MMLSNKRLIGTTALISSAKKIDNARLKEKNLPCPMMSDYPFSYLLDMVFDLINEILCTVFELFQNRLFIKLHKGKSRFFL